ncbi:MAG TPA: Mut7-C RNAse domain-containing protein [Egibacteraceae bacterium]
MDRVTVRLYGDLADLAWGADRSGEAQVPAPSPRSVKDAIESLGVPHTEVDLVLVNGDSVGFDHLVVGGDRVSVYPHFADLDVPSAVRPPPVEPPRFVLDVHLGRLAERLRLLGFDTLYSRDLDDADLAALSVAGPRWLLTRDRGLLMRRVITHGYLVRSTDPTEQVHEVVRRFGLADAIAQLTRCARCNGLLHAVDKAEIIDRLQPGTAAEHHVFTRCEGCGQLYWPGSHRGALQAFVDEVRGGAERSV